MQGNFPKPVWDSAVLVYAQALERDLKIEELSDLNEALLGKAEGDVEEIAFFAFSDAALAMERQQRIKATAQHLFAVCAPSDAISVVLEEQSIFDRSWFYSRVVPTINTLDQK